MTIVGLSGYARAGKDAAAAVMVNELGYTRIAFADIMRDFLYRLNPIVGRDITFIKNVYVKDVIDEVGWDGYKSTPYGDQMRGLMQRLGTDCGRELLGQDIWVDSALNGLDRRNRYVVSDVRFPNEAEAIVKRYGSVWRIERKDNAPVNAHISEVALDEWPFHGTINNYGTLEAFQQKVRRAFK